MSQKTNSSFSRTRALTIGTFLVLFLGAGLLAGQILGFLPSSRLQIHGTAFAASSDLGVFQDSACKTVLTAIDWGSVGPRMQANRTVYVKNVGNQTIAVSAVASNLSPVSLSVSFSYAGSGIGPGAAFPLTISFLASSGVTGSFSFDIVLTSQSQAAPAPSVYNVSLQSTGPTANLGTISFNGTVYGGLPKSFSKSAGSYRASYAPASGYVFDHWEVMGGISVSSTSANPTTSTVLGNGALRAVYTAAPPSTYALHLESRQSDALTSNNGGITLGGTVYSSLPADIAKAGGNYQASYASATGYMFDHWEVTGGLSVSSTAANPATLTVTGTGTLRAVYGVQATTYTISLQSSNKDSLSSNLGTFTFDGIAYGLPKSVSRVPGSYQVGYTPASGFVFDHWEVANGVTVSSTSTNPTSVTVKGAGTLRAVYKTVQAPNYVFSDGFESGNLKAWSSTQLSGGERIAVSPEAAFSGSYGGAFTTSGNGGYEYAQARKSITGMSQLYARVYVKVVANGVADSGDYLYFLSLRAGSNNVAFAGWRMDRSGLRWHVLARNNNGYVGTYSTSVPAAGRWYCVELYWQMSGTNGRVTLWVDGLQVASISGFDTDNFGAVTQVRFGVAEAYRISSSTVHVDVAVISDRYVEP